ncbi:hypothetical protein M409DRAFT_24994 [Zasmidium cellare ATCC 36951]|uniref:Uncharacterized protein n=1 Tax=Zasmidium cellare ATCC 36951 TaxID=1080233 RepID=A0A6A6CG09_ZASCE|nr:uncharacterized protein M409DRAFT_24994 [Zasmidium cellare ATCC 36951]KAF2164599.1 hypothetical protein M409DRAFT_24994 [Zasmidium cellare ATCC 36951]
MEPDEKTEQPIVDQANEGGNFSSYIRVFRYADRQSWILNGIAFVAAIGAGVPLPLMDLVFGQFVTAFVDFSQGRYSPDQYMNQVVKYTLYFIYLFVAKFVLVYIHTVCVSMAAIRTTKALRVDFMTSLLRQEIAYFDSKDAGSPSVKVTSTANLVNQGISEKLSLTIQSLTTFVTAFIIAFAVQWKLTLITIGIVPAIIIVTTVCVAIDTKNETKLLSIYSRAGLLAEEVFSSIATVHSFWLHPEMVKRYDNLVADAEKEGLKKRPNLGILYSFEYFVVFSGYGLAFWRGCRMYASGEIEESGKVVTVIFAVIVAATILTQIAPQIMTLSKAISAADDLFKTIDRQSKIDSLATQGDRPSGCKGKIEVKDIRFSYPSRPDDEILRGLNLDIPAGKTTALVGASGSGKSTIIGLLERWYDQSHGVITIDGIDIRELDIQWLRQNIRLVQQEPVLFSGSVFDNVAYGLIGTPYEHSPQEEKMRLVEQACIDAFADQFIRKLPQQYNTSIGERARMLSGGQKQRIAIARSIISNPPILLLDEATSALDPKAEQVVQRALNNVSANRTTITIAHKLSTIRDSDSIAVISKGAVIEQGTHDELLAQNGAYSRLVNAQNLGGGSNSNDDSESDVESGEDGKLERNASLARTKSERVDIDPDEDSDEEKETMNYGLLRCIWMLLKNEPDLWPHFFISAVCCILGGGTYPAQAVLLSRTFGVFQLQDASRIRSRGDFWALMFFIIALANLVIYFIVGWSTTVISQKLTRRYRLRLFKTTIHQDMEFFDQASHASGGMTSKLSSCATNMQELMGINIGLILINITNVTSSSIFGIIVGWKLGLVCVFGALPPLLFSGYLRIRLETALDDATSKRFASSAAIAAEAISAIRTVASLTLERTILDIYQDRLANVASKATKALFWTMFWYSLTQSISFLAMALGFWYGGKLVSTGEYDTTQFFAIFIAVIFGGEATAAFFQYTTSITKAQIAANFMFWLEHRAPKQDMDPSMPSPDEKDVHGPAAIGYDDLTFAYPARPNIPILNGIDVTIPPGKFAAFVGPSGCGKTTMISLLSRFYDPSSGSISLNKQAITDLTPRHHRRRIALVQQEPILYQGSIRDNVALGIAESREATEAEIEKACTQANIWDFVKSLPEGLNTFVGMRGSQLSGGQRQRVAIARAIIRDPSVLLLDEATSALDTESEKIVQAALMDAAQEGSRTTVAVAHRLSTIRDADYIFVFEAGKIVESGSHNFLLQKRGRYYQMCQGQALDRAV